MKRKNRERVEKLASGGERKNTNVYWQNPDDTGIFYSVPYYRAGSGAKIFTREDVENTTGIVFVVVQDKS